MHILIISLKAERIGNTLVEWGIIMPSLSKLFSKEDYIYEAIIYLHRLFSR